jgi:Mg2+ and Co2+ transporter CorA
VGEITPLAGVFAYETPLLPISPRQWTLWAMLILAVLVLLWMAWTLIGEKSTATRDEQ